MPQPSAAPTGQVFLSYSRADRDAAIALRAALEQAGLVVFHDEDAIRVGDQWMTRLQDALKSCSAFVLLVGRDGVRRWVGAEVQVALNRHLGPQDDAERLPIYPLLLEGTSPEALPPFFALFQAERWTVDEPLPAALLDAIRRRISQLRPLEVFEGCPFLGLGAFQQRDSRLFFGRRQETLEALACLGSQQETNPEKLKVTGGSHYHRWLQIEGNSGAGKSSLVNAGMLPMIEHGALWARTGFDNWCTLDAMMPGLDPVAKLAETLERGLISDPTKRDSLGLLGRLMSDERALAFALKDFKQEHTAFLLIVDQFEELFTFAADASRKQFDALLAIALQDPECPLFLVSTVRADFLDRFELLPRLGAIYNSHCKRYFLPGISEHGLREVIEQPARLADLDVTEVAALIRADAREEIGALPLVENALFTLWQTREGNRLSAEHYRRANGMAGMLSAQADSLLKRIDGAVPKGELAALELLLRLTRINDEGRHTRQRVTRQEAVMVAGHGNDSIGERVVRMLSGERALDAPSTAHNGALRLITTSTEQDVPYVDLIHETLIRARTKDEKTGRLIGYWPTLYDFIEKNRDRAIHRQQLKFQTEQWRRSRGLGRVWNLAYIDFGHYRALRIPPGSPEGRFLTWSQWARRGLMLVLALLVGFVGDAYYWTRKNDLPLDSMLTLQRFRLGFKPLPTMAPPIPAGTFNMGEQDAKFLSHYAEQDQRYFGIPAHRVRIAKGFSLGKHEVTYEQFDYYVWGQQRSGHDGMKFPTGAKGGRGTRPVVNVTWPEAAAYAKWVGEQTHQLCRLPTEAEWEYAARAGTSTAYWWGDEISRERANCEGCGSRWDKDQSAPVGSFPANAFGLHDTSGNVWEWTCSPWRDKFDRSEQQCVAEQNPVTRAARGGSWDNDARGARSGARDAHRSDSRGYFLGFRVLCTPLEN